MAAVRAMALVCDAALWQLLRSIGSDAHILDVLPKMWPAALAFFDKAAASPASVIDDSLRLQLDDAPAPKVTARSQRAAADMARIRLAAAGDKEQTPVQLPKKPFLLPKVQAQPTRPKLSLQGR